VIKGTIDCVLYHDEAIPSPSPGAILRLQKACAPSRTYVIVVTPTVPPTQHNYVRFRGVFDHVESLDPMAKGRVSIVVERCKACGFCVEFCPTKVLALSSAFNSKGYHPPHVVHPEKCSGCDLCGMYCPDFAIYATKVLAGGGDR
jgi:2-oxoglutarate ferredoxin oxidoreductase subunit delta